MKRRGGIPITQILKFSRFWQILLLMSRVITWILKFILI